MMEELARGNRVSDYRTLTPSELWDKYQKYREKNRPGNSVFISLIDSVLG
jgi:hypothetical protein